MIKIKGHRITKKIAKLSIEAMERLIYLYKNSPEYKGPCPLCGLPEAPECICGNCPWSVMVKEEFACLESFFDVVAKDPKRRKKRIRQLYYWISVYRKALNDGGKI